MQSSQSSYVYSGFELALILSGEQALFAECTTPGGYADPSSLAEVCARRIESIFTLEFDTPHTETLRSFIAHIVSEADCAIAVPAKALELITQYQRVLASLGDTDAHSVPAACELFLSAYMAAARAIHDVQSYASFWTRVARGKYDAAELAAMERGFMEVVEWEVPGYSPHGSEETSGSGSNNSWDMDECQWSGDEDSTGTWLFNSGPGGSDGKSIIDEIPMIDDEDEEMFLLALKTPKPAQLGICTGPKQISRDGGRGFRRSSRMCNES